MTTETAELEVPGRSERLQSEPSVTEAEVRPVSMPFVDRLASAVITGAPPILLIVGIVLGWGGVWVNWQDITNLVISYVVIGSGASLSGSTGF